MHKNTKDKRALSRSIMDKAIALLEAALQDDRQAIALRDSILEAYGPDTNNRAKLFRDFYHAYSSLLGFTLPESSFTDPNSMWPFRIDQAMASLMERHIPETTQRNYQALMERAMDRFMALDPDNYPLYDVYFGGFHQDLFYFAGMQVHSTAPNGTGPNGDGTDGTPACKRPEPVNKNL